MKIKYEGFPYKSTLKMFSLFPLVTVIAGAIRITKDGLNNRVFHEYDKVTVIRFGWLFFFWKIEVQE